MVDLKKGNTGFLAREGMRLSKQKASTNLVERCSIERLRCLFSVPRETCSLGQNRAEAYNCAIAAESGQLEFGI